MFNFSKLLSEGLDEIIFFQPKGSLYSFDHVTKINYTLHFIQTLQRFHFALNIHHSLRNIIKPSMNGLNSLTHLPAGHAGDFRS